MELLYFTCIVVLIIFFIFLVTNENSSEPYRTFRDYKQMSRLPWVLPPTRVGSGSLGGYQAEQVRKRFPGLRFIVGEIPDSCPSNCPNLGGRMSQTGNSFNPNTYSYIGTLSNSDIRY